MDRQTSAQSYCVSPGVSLFGPILVDVRLSGRLGGDSMFPLRLRRRVDPYPFLDIRLINERQYNIKENNHIWCIIHTRFHAGCLPDIFVPPDHVNANANDLASSYTCGHPRVSIQRSGLRKLRDRLPCSPPKCPKGKSPLSVFTFKVSVPSLVVEKGSISEMKA